MPTQTVHFPGSSGYRTGEAFPMIYPLIWNPVTRQVETRDPSNGRYNIFGTTGRGINGAPVAGAAPGSPNPFFTLENTKSKDVDSRLGALFGDFDKLRGMDPTGEIKARLDAAAPDFKRFLGEDMGAADAYYNGSVQSQLDALRGQRKAAYAQAVDRALAGLGRTLSLEQMGRGGGLSSYISKLALDKSADLMSKAALDEADQARSDFDYLQRGRLGLMGSRAGLVEGDIRRALLPSSTAAQWYANLVASLSPVTQLKLANTFYGLGKARGDVFPQVYGDYSGVQNSPVIPQVISPNWRNYLPR